MKLTQEQQNTISAFARRVLTMHPHEGDALRDEARSIIEMLGQDYHADAAKSRGST